MTLVASFEFHKTPILIGDVLITEVDRQRHEMTVRETDIRQKIVKMANNCAIGWAGNLTTANSVYRAIRKNFEKETYSLKKLENAFLVEISGRGTIFLNYADGS